MSKNYQLLPEYQSIVRWSVQEVVNWLSQNGMSDCVRSFRNGGVDGNKLVNVTATDLHTINCPKKHIPEILHIVSKVIKPGMKRNGRGMRQAQVCPPNEQSYNTDPGIIKNQESGSGSEDSLWSDDEWDSQYSSDESNEVHNIPVAQPRPNRGLPQIHTRSDPPPNKPILPETDAFPDEVYEDPDRPPQKPDIPPSRPPLPPPIIPQEDGEDYEDPDQAARVRNFHGGPLPTPPTRNSPMAQRQLPPTPSMESEQLNQSNTTPCVPSRRGLGPTLPSRSDKPRALPSIPTESLEEDYEEPDTVSRPPPIQVRAPPPPAQFTQEDYEEPDAVSSKPPIQRRAPTKPAQFTQEDYEDLDGPNTNSNPDDSVQEEYEEPDISPMTSRPPQPVINPRRKQPPPPPVDSIQPTKTDNPPPVPANVPKRKPSVKSQASEQEEVSVYESLDDVDNVTSSTKHPTKPTCPLPEIPKQACDVYEEPEQNNDQEGDNYLEMDECDIVIDKFNSNMQRSINVPSRRQEIQIPQRTPVTSQKHVQVEEQETYEDPDTDLSNTSSSKIQKNHPTRPDRSLPAPPANTKKSPVTKSPSSSSTDSIKSVPKQFTEADLMRQKWYHGTITRQDGDRLLYQHRQNGMYFIRKSTQGGEKPYTLQIYYEDKTYNLPIRLKNSGKFALGKDEKANEKTFDNLLVLVNAFKKNPILLAGGKQTILVKSLPKS